MSRVEPPSNDSMQRTELHAAADAGSWAALVRLTQIRSPERGMEAEVTAMRVVGAFALMGLIACAWHQAAAEETPASSKGVSASVNQVWGREDEYWRSAKAGDVDAFLSLWHDKFIGWPCEEAHPKRKAALGGWVREVREKQIRMTYDLAREGAEDFGNVVVVHYRVTGISTYPDGHSEGEGEESKVTHTWMRTGDTWLIIGGMCGSLRDSPK